MVVNGGLRQGQTSTALMVLLLSTALFLIPGFRDQVSINFFVASCIQKVSLLYWTPACITN